MTDDLRPMHVIDRNGFIWRVVRDGGMATRADWAGVTSIGIEELRETRGPVEEVEPLIDAARDLGAAYVEMQERHIRFADQILSDSEGYARAYNDGFADASAATQGAGARPMTSNFDRFAKEVRESLSPQALELYEAMSDSFGQARVEALQMQVLRLGGILEGFAHSLGTRSSKPSDPDDVRWECFCGIGGAPERVERHWLAELRDTARLQPGDGEGDMGEGA